MNTLKRYSQLEIEQGKIELRSYLINLWEEIKVLRKLDSFKEDEEKFETLKCYIRDAITVIETYTIYSSEQDWHEFGEFINEINFYVEYLNENQRTFARAMLALKGGIEDPTHNLPISLGEKKNVVILSNYRNERSQSGKIEDAKIKNEVQLSGKVIEVSKFPGNKESFSLLGREIRINRIEGLQFGENGFSSIKNQRETTEKIHKALSQNGKDLSGIFGDDLSFQEDTIKPVGMISNNMIQSAIEIAERKRDGGFAIQISKDLQIKAANDEIFDKNTESSTSLTDHIENISPKNPIRIKTVEFPRFDILSLTEVKFRGAEGTYHKARVQLIDKQVDFIIRCDTFEVGDLSRKLLGTIDDSGKFVPMKNACTIRNIRSQKVQQESSVTGKIGNFFGKVKSWFTKKST